MPDSLAPSEFGGKVGPTGVQPLPHEPTASEKLMLTYRTGSEDGIVPDDGSSFQGLLAVGEQLAIEANY